jgi:glycosyltransferase involved in cell wall biosynthesis
VRQALEARVIDDAVQPVPPVTFAIPFYSGLVYLPRAIESVLAQRDPSWQAFVVDNDSPERGAEAVVRGFRDDRIRYLRNPRNLGMAGNFNRCLDLAETDLVTLLHSDDELLPGYCGTVRAAAGRHPSAAAFYCRAEIIGEDSQPTFSLPDFVKYFIDPSPRREHVLAGEAGVRALLRSNFIMAPTLCFRKSVLADRRFPEGPQFVLDLELTTSLLLAGESLVGVPERCYRYRRHGGSATAEFTRTQHRFREESDYYDRMRAIAEARQWDRCARLAARKSVLKLNVTFCALRSFARLRLGQARRELQLLRQL